MSSGKRSTDPVTTTETDDATATAAGSPAGLIGMDVNRDAQVVVELNTVIDAPLDVVWSLHTDIGHWPAWQKDVTAVQLSGPVAPGTSFTWQTHGLSITSTIGEVAPQRRIVWSGPAHGIDGVHVWTFEETPDGVAVHTAESWDGPSIAADPDGMRTALTASLTSWLAALKTTAESAGHHRSGA